MAGNKLDAQDPLEKLDSEPKSRSRLLNGIDVFVDFLEDKISWSTIGTDSISSCTFILVVGRLQDLSFAYLSHYPECFEPPAHTQTSTLVHLINQISANIEQHIRKSKETQGETFEITELNDLHLLVGGGVEEEVDLIRESFILLNQSNCNIENLFEEPSSKYFYRQLKYKATILSSTTILLSDDEEDEEDDDHGSIFDDSALVIKYDCLTKILNIYIEWIGFGMACNIASLSFIFGVNDLSKVLWHKEENEIRSIREKFKSNKRQLQAFNNALSYIVKSVFINRNGHPFELNRKTIGYSERFVENENNSSIEDSEDSREFHSIEPSLQHHHTLVHCITCHSGSSRPLSKPFDTFTLYSTPLSRVIRPLCLIRHLARRPFFSIDINEIVCQWRKTQGNIRNTCLHLQEIYQKEHEKKKSGNKRLKDIFPFPLENKEEVKCLEEFFFKFANQTTTDRLNNFPIRYPKLLNNSGDCYAQYTNSNLSIMKKRSRDSSENSSDAPPPPKRTLIIRQNRIQTKSSHTLSHPGAYPLLSIDPPNGVFLCATKDMKQWRKEIPRTEIRRIARGSWKKLRTNLVSYVDDETVLSD